MARVQYGGGVTALKGSIVGNTFQSNPSGAIVRARSGTGKKGTAKQMLSRQVVVNYNSLWQQLLLGYQMEWNDYAASHTRTNPFGETKAITGANWHQSINFNLQSFGNAYVNVPPAYTLPPAVTAYTLVLTATTISIVFDTSFSPTNSGLIIWVTAPTSRVSTSLRSQFRTCTLTVASPFTTIDITSDWNLATGLDYASLPSGSRFKIGCMVQTCEQTSGLCSPGLLTISEIAITSGIGSMRIGTTFIVS